MKIEMIDCFFRALCYNRWWKSLRQKLDGADEFRVPKGVSLQPKVKV